MARRTDPDRADTERAETDDARTERVDTERHADARTREPAQPTDRHADTRTREPAQPTDRLVTAPAANGPAVTALVTGLFAATFGFLGITALAALIFGVVAIVTGVMGIQRAGVLDGAHKGNAITGLVSGILGVILAVAVLVGGALLFDELDRVTPDQLQEELDNIEINVD